MSDFFGISTAIRGVVEIYFRAAQRTGRTTHLLQSVKEGDLVVFATANQAREFEWKCKERKIMGVSVISIPPSQPQRIFERGTAKGRVIWDHDWLEQHYLLVLDDVEKGLLHISEQASGRGEAHLKTERMAKDNWRWQIR